MREKVIGTKNFDIATAASKSFAPIRKIQLEILMKIDNSNLFNQALLVIFWQYMKNFLHIRATTETEMS